ncbi:MAG: TerC family protein [Deltaproteobacteria bacterium]|nr:TerC family protein [Deltaproteobacteria bacterium]
MDGLLQVERLFAVLTLTTLEVILGIDNIIVLAITVGRLPPAQRARARTIGLILAMGMRLGLLTTLNLVMRLTRPLFWVFQHPVSGRDLILLLGGLFLMGKSAHEIYESVELPPSLSQAPSPAPASATVFLRAIVQIVLLDIVFSLDSVIAALGMSRDLPVMCIAVVIAALGMLFFAKTIGDFVDRHPSAKVLALAFLMLIGVLLVADGMGQHVSKGYVYFAMTFAFGVELVNIRARQRASLVPHRLSQEPTAPQETPRGGSVKNL